jgi:peptide/nickel transport system permease protein
MMGFIAKRLLATLPVILVVAMIVFLLLYLTPGDPAVVLAGDLATADDVARIRSHLGLDQAVYLRFAIWLLHLIKGDLGVSVFSNLPVTELIMQRAEPTLSLALTSLVIALPMAITLGVLAAWRAGGWLDRAMMLFAVIGFSMPIFVLGYCLVYLFSIELEFFPVQGFTSLRQGLGPFLRTMILPAVTLSVVYIALLARMTRTSMLEVMHEDFIRTARAKGVKEIDVLLFHGLRNAAVPIVTMIGISTALLISGSVVVESIYNLPGIGRLLVDAIVKRDYPVIQGVVLIFSFLYVVVNLLVDLAYAFLDPRIRY